MSTSVTESASSPLDQLLIARIALPPFEFRARLRRHLLAEPSVTLRQVASALGVSRQAVGALVGRLDRPTCAHPDRPAPRRDQARARLAELTARVAAGESAESAAGGLGISLAQAARLGFRAKEVRPPHGKGRANCDCWRCRRAAGVARPRGRRAEAAQREAALDWLAWVDPDEGTALTQAEIGRLAGVRQSAVSRLARAALQGAGQA